MKEVSNSYSVFQELLNKNGVTAFKVSNDTGISPSTLTAWKCGQYEPTGKKIYVIAKYFDVPMEVFYQ